MTLRQAASRLNIGQEFACKQARAGKLGTKTSGRWDISEADLKAYREKYLGRPGRK